MVTISRKRMPVSLACALTACALNAVPALAGSAREQAQQATNPLLAVDLNRTTLVTRFIQEWGSARTAPELVELRKRLDGARADRLLAASLQNTRDAALMHIGVSLPSTDTLKAVGETTRDLVYTPITPRRLLDTRGTFVPTCLPGGGAFGNGEIRDYDVTTASCLPAGVSAIVATVYSGPVAVGAVSDVFADQQGGTFGAVAVEAIGQASGAFTGGTVVIPVNVANNQISLKNSVSAANIIVDVTGYFQAASRTGDGLRVTSAVRPDGTVIAPNVVNGSSGNVGGSATIPGTTIAGGGCVLGTNCSATNKNMVDSDFGSILGGNTNRAWFYASVGGGFGNDAGGSFAVIPGGTGNLAYGNYSFAGGRGAKTLAAGASPAPYHGAFVWADSAANGSAQEFRASAVDQFAVRSRGGVVFKVASSTLASDAAAGCSLPAGGAASWSCTSDRNAKEAFNAISPKAILARVAALPLTTWQFKGTERRHLSPMAQDFWAAFGLGMNDTTITSSDVSGVALGAIQGLNQKLAVQLKQKDAEIAALKRDMAAIKRKLGM